MFFIFFALSSQDLLSCVITLLCIHCIRMNINDYFPTLKNSQRNVPNKCMKALQNVYVFVKEKNQLQLQFINIHVCKCYGRYN